jgi:hypothetical protein
MTRENTRSTHREYGDTEFLKPEPAVILEKIETPDTLETAFGSSSVSQPEVSQIVKSLCTVENGNEFLIHTDDTEEWKTPENTPSDLVRAFNSRARSDYVLVESL